MSFIDYVHVITKFLVSNYKNFSEMQKNQGNKLHYLFLKNPHHNSITSLNPDKTSFYFSSHILEAY